MISQEQQSKNAIAWIEALLSGKYKQGKECLGNHKNGFCCWGVGCLIVNKIHPSSPIVWKEDDSWNDDLASYLGFKDSDGLLKKPFYNSKQLSEINDSTHAGFKRIAKMLIKTADDNFEPEVANAIKTHFNKN